jgi:6-pyruvoyl-tetrahydropterin synthase
MQVHLTKRFFFSASYSRAARVHAHNYTLGVTVTLPDEDYDESFLEARVRETLVDKVHSRDLGLHVDFLKGCSITELSLVTVFWGIVKKAVAPAELVSLTLEKDKTSQWTLRS